MNSTILLKKNSLSLTCSVAAKLLASFFLLALSTNVYAAKIFTALGVGSQTGSVTTGTAGSVTYTVTGTFSGNGNASCGPLSVSGLPSGVTYTTPTLSASGTTTSVTATLTLTTSVATPAVSNASFTVSCTASSGGNYTANSTLTVNSIVLSAVAEYRFDDAAWCTPTSAVDTVGGHNGTLISSVTWQDSPAAGSKPINGAAAGFSASAVDVTGLSLNLAGGAVNSVSFWMYWDGTDNVMPMGFGQYDLWLRSGFFGFNTFSSDVFGIASTGLANGWHHVAAVFTNGNVTSNKLWIDGVQQSLTQRTGLPNNTNAIVSSQMRLSGVWGAAGYLFSGKLDVVRVYSGLMTQTQVNADMALSNPAVVCTVPPPTLVANYMLDDNWDVTHSALNTVSGGPSGTIATPYAGKVATPAVAPKPNTCYGAAFTTSTGSMQTTGVSLDLNGGGKNSVSFWMYWTGVDSQMPFGFKVHDLWLQGGSFGFNSGNSDIFGIASTGLANSWHHVAAVFTNGNIPANKMWIDGVPQTLTQRSSTPSVANSYAANTFQFSSWTNSTGYRFGGTLDELKVYRGELDDAQVALDMQGHACAPGVLDHIRITHSGNGLTCSPEVLTVTACANAACTSPHFTGTPVTGSVTWAGAPGGSVPFNITVGGTTQIGLPVTTVQTVTLGTIAVSPTPVSASDCVNSGGGSACSLSFADSGLILNVPNHVSETSQNITISAVRKADNAALCVPAFASVTRAINLKCAYTNPSSGTRSVRIGGNALNATNNAVAACDSTGRSINFAFNATGVATGTLQYADVGKVTLNASYSGSGATADAGLGMTGTTSFVAAPASFAFSNITGGLIKAGSVYSARITARNSANNATPNFGKEAFPEGVTLSVNLASGYNPGIPSPNDIVLGSGFVNGVANLSNLSWSEVGLITMTANLTSAAYLGTTFTATGVSGNTGPFIPDHFDTVTSGGMVCPGGLVCGTPFNGIVYSGQAFTTQVKAFNLGGTVTQNYDGTLGYSNAVILSAWSTLGGTSSNPGPGTLTSNTIAASAFQLGVANTNMPIYTFATSPKSPTNIFMRAIDTVHVTVSSRRASSVEGVLRVVSGRSKISNAYGSELLPLTLTVNAQLWDGTSWVTSTTDGSTQFNSNLNSAAGNIVPTIVKGPLSLGNVSVSAPGLVTMTAGARTFTLNTPGVTGSVDLRLNAPSYLFTGSNNAAVDPSIAGRASFGVYSGNPNLIYQREAY